MPTAPLVGIRLQECPICPGARSRPDPRRETDARRTHPAQPRAHRTPGRVPRARRPPVPRAQRRAGPGSRPVPGSTNGGGTMASGTSYNGWPANSDKNGDRRRLQRVVPRRGQVRRRHHRAPVRRRAVRFAGGEARGRLVLGLLLQAERQQPLQPLLSRQRHHRHQRPRAPQRRRGHVQRRTARNHLRDPRRIAGRSPLARWRRRRHCR